MTLPRFSANGWPMLRDSGRLISYKEFGVTWRFANHDVMTVFQCFNRDYNELVEPIAPPDERVRDEGTWNPRLIAGTTKGSNHGSGTAEDINALRHPSGVPLRSTFTAKKIRTVKGLVFDKYVDSYGHPVLRWGGLYVHAPTDGMHYEINTSPVHVAQCVAILRKQGLIK